MNANPKIQAYGAIGDGRSVALISRFGSMDWLCWPRFDSASIFGALLDAQRGGRWIIQPTATAETTWQYLPDTNVLQTHFRTHRGTTVLTDFMAVASEEQKKNMLWPEQELVREVKGAEGENEIEVWFDPRPDYGRAKVKLRYAGESDIRLEMGSWLLLLRGDIRLLPDSRGGASARVRLRAGETITFSLSYSAESPAVLPPLGEHVAQKKTMSMAWWRHWASQSRYDGPYRDAVTRSALLLKLLFYAPSGAMIAAPTTSLPERIGGDLNWDYRYCWLRDAAFTSRALFGLGFNEEAEAFVSWLLHATQLTRPKLKVVYDVFGCSLGKEQELHHWSGYAASRPVRISNAAQNQFQLDLYGEVIDAVSQLVQHGGRLDRETQSMLLQLGKYVCDHWHEPDKGIWEPREGRKHFTHSRLFCWLALDRLLYLYSQGQLVRAPVEQFQKQREAIRRDIEEHCWNPQLQSYVQSIGSSTLDAALLQMAMCGFHEASSERMGKTFLRMKERLSAAPGLLYRFERPAGEEGAFGMCSFWAAEFLAAGGGTIKEAHAALQATLSHANDLGLMAEEVDPTTGDALGNFPQAFTHVGLINAALTIAERERHEGHNSRVQGHEAHWVEASS